MLCLSFYEWRCIYSGEQMSLAPFLVKPSLDKAARRFADFLCAPKHAKADVLLTTVLGPLHGLVSQYLSGVPTVQRTGTAHLRQLMPQKKKQVAKIQSLL